MDAVLTLNNAPTSFLSAKIQSAEHVTTVTLHLNTAVPTHTPVTLSLHNIRIFTGTIVRSGENAHETQAVACGYSYRLFSLPLQQSSYHNIKATEAVHEILAQLHITETHITLPDLTLPHFSWGQNSRGALCIQNIINAVEAEHENISHRYFSNALNTFVLGAKSSTQELPYYPVISQADIITRTPSAHTARTLLLPLLAHQTLTLINTPITITSSTIFISPENSYTEIFYE